MESLLDLIHPDSFKLLHKDRVDFFLGESAEVIQIDVFSLSFTIQVPCLILLTLLLDRLFALFILSLFYFDLVQGRITVGDHVGNVSLLGVQIREQTTPLFLIIVAHYHVVLLHASL